MEDKVKQELKEWGAKWLVAVIENGEPYDNLNDVKWEDYADDYHEAMLQLFDQILSEIEPLIRKDERERMFNLLLSHKEYQRRWKGGMQILFGFTPDEVDELRLALKGGANEKPPS